MHLYDNETPEVAGQRDKLKKIRWYHDYLNKKFPYNFIPNENATIDESMIKFKGRLSFRQYLPAKPTKWGGKAVEFGRQCHWLHAQIPSLYW